MSDPTVIHLKRKRRRTRSLLTWLGVGALVALGAMLAAAAGFYFVRQAALSLGGPGGLFAPVLVEGSPTPRTDPQGTPLPPLPGETALPSDDLPAPELTAWDGAGRVTVLLLGLDFRDWDEENQTEASRSDTMILLTLDPQAKTAGVLSIPRDLWVAIPGFQHGKINTAYYLGDAYKLPGGGPGLAVKTVEQFLGVPVNYYAQIDFETFERFIDEIGGVEVDVPAPIKIDLLGDGQRTIKNLKAGKQVLPGAYALAYARNRKTENGDFDRAFRQQQVIMGIRNQVLSFKMLPKLIARAPKLYADLSSGIRTNLQLDEVIKLALLAEQVEEANIQRALINKDNVLFGESPDGLSILIPLPDDIHALRDQVFAGGGSIGPQLPGDAAAQMKAEAARVLIYNESGDPAFGSRLAEYLRTQGVNVIQAQEASQAAGTTIIDHSGSPYALKYLVELFKIPQARIRIEFQPETGADVELHVGSDLLQAGIIP